MAKWRKPQTCPARINPYARGNITRPSVQQNDPVLQLQPTMPDYQRLHEGGSSQTYICNDSDGVPDWLLVDRLIEDRHSAYGEIHKLARQKMDADAQIQNLVREQEAANKRRTQLSKKNEVLQDLIKTLKWPDSEDRVGKDTKVQIKKLRRDLKVTKAQLSYHLDHPYSNHVHELQEAEQRLLLANSKVRMLEGYLYGQSLETNPQQAVGAKEVGQRSSSF